MPVWLIGLLVPVACNVLEKYVRISDNKYDDMILDTIKEIYVKKEVNIFKSEDVKNG